MLVSDVGPMNGTKCVVLRCVSRIYCEAITPIRRWQANCHQRFSELGESGERAIAGAERFQFGAEALQHR